LFHIYRSAVRYI